MSSDKEIIDYLKEDMKSIEIKMENGFRDLNTKIDVFMANYVHKEDFKEKQKDISDRIEKIEKGKVDKEIFEPFQKGLNRVNWIVLTAVIAGILALIFK